MRKLRKILLSTIFALTVSTTFFANTAGTQTVTAASGTAVTFKRKVIAYRTGSVYNFVPMGNAADNRRALNLLMEGNEKKVININNNVHIDTYLRPGNIQQSTLANIPSPLIKELLSTIQLLLPTQTLKTLQSTAASGRILPPVD